MLCRSHGSQAKLVPEGSEANGDVQKIVSRTSFAVLARELKCQVKGLILGVAVKNGLA